MEITIQAKKTPPLSFVIMNIKSAITFWILILFLTTFVSAQNKYKRTYILKFNHFRHTASYASGNAIIYIDRDSLIENFQSIAKLPSNGESFSGKIKNTADTLLLLAKKNDTTNISSLLVDPKIINITLSYFSKCILSKKATVFDKRRNRYVKKILVKKSAHSSRKSSTYSYYYYYLPKDRNEFMYRIERSGSGNKFL